MLSLNTHAYANVFHISMVSYLSICNLYLVKYNIKVLEGSI